MDIKTLEQLDYVRIRSTIAGYCMSSEGKALLLERLPFTSQSDIDSWKIPASEWKLYLDAGKTGALKPWEPCAHLFSKLPVEGAVLELDQVYALGQFCISASHLKSSLSSVELNIPHLMNKSSSLPSLEGANDAIFRIIDASGQLRDLSELRDIRRSISSIRRDIENTMRSYTSDVSLRDALQSDVPALRSDRQVLAVKANFRGKVRGIVHEVSQTGQTVYIEPDDIVQKNNDLVQEEHRLSQEIRRILKELTSSLKEFYDSFVQSHAIMLELDASFAAARWGKEVQGTFAFETSGERGLTLKKARHPLLGSSCVPIDVEFTQNCRVLIITGPNTGGKTVTLKTIALFALLNQSGFPIPANEGSSLPVFSSVFADIGDEQSLDQSLSTFSGHMKNIGLMLSQADKSSLVLLDELGSGTDPQEGGAIAMAVLDTLIERNAMVLVTTHHGILKNYGYTHSSCTNASVEFDSQTLSPTYRILMGVPGESHALDIARRSGLPVTVADKAQRYMENNEADVSELIKGLTAKHGEAALLEKELRKKEQYINEKWRKVDLKSLSLKQKELELREEGYKKSKSFLDESRRMLENLVRELKEGEGTITREKTLKVKETIALLSQSVDEENESLSIEKESYLSAVKDDEDKILSCSQELSPGCPVIIRSSKMKGEIIGKAKKDSWLVQVGSLKMTVSEKDLIPCEGKVHKPSISIEMEKEDVSSDSRVSFSSPESSVMSAKPAFELRLLGMRYEEAMKALERQLDLCAIHHLNSFSVIHGKGNGILQQGVHQYLKNYGGIKEFHFALPEDGGTGKTYVNL
ncbi:MAG TPA: endonuclease MutS2 [Treponemataceae bacterium]|nr:endonuclease MutS2 [Treponemataceae bacterium]